MIFERVFCIFSYFCSHSLSVCVPPHVCILRPNLRFYHFSSFSFLFVADILLLSTNTTIDVSSVISIRIIIVTITNKNKSKVINYQGNHC